MKSFLGILILTVILFSGCSSQMPARNTDTRCLDPEAVGEQTGAAVGMGRARADSPASDQNELMFSPSELSGMQTKEFADSAYPVQKMEPYGLRITQSKPVYGFFSVEDFREESSDGAEIVVGKTTDIFMQTGSDQTDLWLNEEIQNAMDRNGEHLSQLTEQAEKAYTSLKKQPGAHEFYPFSYYVYAGTARQDSSVVSLRISRNAYSGGAHPLSWQDACNYDLRSCRQLALTDILIPGQQQALLELVLWTVENQMNILYTNGLYANYQDIITESIVGNNVTNNWFFNENGLIIFYNIDDVAPYAAGVVEVALAYDELHQILKPEYFPESHSESGGELCVISNENCTNPLTVNLQENAESQVWICNAEASGEIYDLKVFRVTSWVNEDTPVIGSMVFAASNLNLGSQIQIVSDAEIERAYYLTYRDSDDQTIKQVLDRNGLQKINP